MLTAITFENFRSYQQARLPLASLTVLIGANASGKSNAIEGMRLLSWLAQGNKLQALSPLSYGAGSIVRGRIEDLACFFKDSFGLGCELGSAPWGLFELSIHRRQDGLHIVRESIPARDGGVPLYVLTVPSKNHDTDVEVAYNNFAKGRNKPHITCSDQQAIFTQLTSPAAFADRHSEARRTIPQVVRRLERALSSILFLDAVPARMRDYSHPMDQRLHGDGGNLSSVLWRLWGQDATAHQEPFVSQRQAILSFIQSLPEQDISGLDFLEEPRGGVMVRLQETFGGIERKYDASLLSDGTLRVLAIAAAMLSAEPGSLVVIEEIDNGVHPSRARHLLEQIRALAEKRQLRVLLSTHNPALLDALPDSALPDVVFCYRDPKDGSSRLLRLSDAPQYPELVAQGTLGHLVTTGVLERFVKQPQSAEERRKKALEWLEAQRAGGK